MDCTFSVFEVTFDNSERLSAAKLSERLSCMASTGRANVGNEDLFSRGIARSDFPTIFEEVLKDGKSMGLELKDVDIRRRRFTFILKPEEGGCDIRLDVLLEGTSGKIQIDKSDYKFAVVEWTNGEVHTFQRITCGEIAPVMIFD